MVILICDDQKSVHTFLSNSINWKSLGITEILHAYNGRQCLDLLKAQTPDFLLLDIRMPQMTGIDILKEMSAFHIHTITVILSAYSDFSYVKEALTLGAFDYELKPIDTEKLTSILINAADFYRTRCLSSFYRILNGASLQDTALSPDILSHLGIDRYLGILCLLSESASDEQRLQLQEYLQECYKYIISLNGTESYILYPLDRTDIPASVASIKNQYNELCQLIPSDIVKYAVSLPGEQVSDLPRQLEQCRKALTEDFYSGTGFYVFQTYKHSDNVHSLLLEYRSRIYACLTNANGREKIPKILQDLFQVFSDYRLDFEELSDICFDILYYNISLILNQNTTFEFELRQDIKQCKSIHELETLIQDTIEKRFYDNTPVLEKTPLQNIYTYLKEHFSEDISLEELSKKFYISKYALCRGFRQEYQEGLWDFLKRIRMEHAKLLLTNTDLKIYEIAEKCGFSDANYFSNTYRKYYGHTPFQEKKHKV